MTATGMTPDPWQRRVLESVSPRLLICAARQFGKSRVVGALVARTAIVQSPALILILSRALRQSKEFFRKHVLNTLHRLDWPVPPRKQPGATSMELANGSEVIALPSKSETVVGYSGVALLVIDEGARVPDELYHFLKPMLAVSRGRVVALSTPHGKQGWFWEQWEQGVGWERHFAAAPPAGDGCPRHTPEFLAEELREKGPRLFGQEYLGQFNSVIDDYFPEDAIRAAVAGGGRPLFGTAPLFGDATSF
jgi:hypothetical protein